MPKGQKQDNLYKALAIFACSALIFTLIGIGVKAQIVNTYNKATGDELTATHWNNLADDFLFKNIPSGFSGSQKINDNIGINRDLESGYSLTTHTIFATDFYGKLSATNVSAGSFGQLHGGGHYTFPDNLTVNGNISGGVNITATGDTGGNRLCIGTECISAWNDVTASIDQLWEENVDTIHPYGLNKRVGIGTNNVPVEYILDVNGIGRFVEIEMNATEETPVINMNQGNILDVAKITVGTIDPLYRIDGINYSTFASAIVGGVKEELISRALINRKNSSGEYEYVIDFKKEKKGSELWVWYQTVDFNKDNIEVLITPYGSFAQSYYLIEDEKLILRSDKPVEVSYRLMGKRFDWKSWPLKADDQKEAPSFIIDTK